MRLSRILMLLICPLHDPLLTCSITATTQDGRPVPLLQQYGDGILSVTTTSGRHRNGKSCSIVLVPSRRRDPRCLHIISMLVLRLSERLEAASMFKMQKYMLMWFRNFSTCVSHATGTSSRYQIRKGRQNKGDRCTWRTSRVMNDE